MTTPGGMWRRLWRGSRPEDDWEGEESRGTWTRAGLRLAVVFALLFGGVFFAFWWAGSAVTFSAARAGDRSQATWRVSGTVVDAVTRKPIPWAIVEDDPAGQPPFFRADAGLRGDYELATLAEPH